MGAGLLNAFVGVTEDLIRLAKRLELGRSSGVARVLVRVHLQWWQNSNSNPPTASSR